jgi:hypothetical protein
MRKGESVWQQIQLTQQSVILHTQICQTHKQSKVGGASCSPLAGSEAGCSRYFGMAFRCFLNY